MTDICRTRIIWFSNGVWFSLFMSWSMRAARAAETLPAVSPPTDWTGVLIVCGFGLLLALALAIGYAIHARRTPGMQFGEEQINEQFNKLLDALSKSHETIQQQAATIEAQAKPNATQPPAKFPADWN